MAVDTQKIRYIIEFDAKHAERLQRVLTRTQRGVKAVDGSFRKASVGTTGLASNLSRLASRAALTIPIWLALRAAMM